MFLLIESSQTMQQAPRNVQVTLPLNSIQARYFALYGDRRERYKYQESLARRYVEYTKTLPHPLTNPKNHKVANIHLWTQQKWRIDVLRAPDPDKAAASLQEPERQHAQRMLQDWRSFPDMFLRNSGGVAKNFAVKGIEIDCYPEIAARLWVGDLTCSWDKINWQYVEFYSKLYFHEECHRVASWMWHTLWNDADNLRGPMNRAYMPLNGTTVEGSVHGGYVSYGNSSVVNPRHYFGSSSVPSAALDAREAELDRREKTLDEERKKLDKREMGVQVEKRNLDAWESRLKEERSRLDIEERCFDEHVEAVSAREEAVTRKEEGLKTSMSLLKRHDSSHSTSGWDPATRQSGSGMGLMELPSPVSESLSAIYDWNGMAKLRR
jgi:hypothetical protein